MSNRKIQPMVQTLLVHEIFYSIQMEGPFTGVPAVFIRLFGCNLACEWCDTPQKPTDATRMTPQDILKKVEALSDKPLVVVTGGEPLRQNLGQLIQLLLLKRRRIQFETNGTIAMPEGLTHEHTHIVCSPKNRRVKESIIDTAMSFKYTVDIEEGVLADGLPPAVSRPKDASMVRVGPRDNKNFEENVKMAVDICKRYGYVLNIQGHKLLGIK